MSPRRRRYPVLRLVPSVFGVLLAALSCGPPPQPTPLDSPKHRAVWLSPANWAHADADSAAARIRGFATAVALGGSPTLLVPVDAETGAASPDGFDPLAVAIDGGHAHGLGVHAGLTLSVADGEPPAAARARWKEIARHVATHYEVDGLYFSESRDRSAVGAAAEALLVKPYLVVSASSLRHVIGLAPVHGVLAPDDTMSWRAKGSQVVGLDLTAWLTSGAADRVVHVDSAAHEPTTDANGHLVILLPDRPDTLRVVADGDTLALQLFDGLLDAISRRDNVQSSFRGDFFPSFRYERGLIGFDGTGNLEDLSFTSKFEIELHVHSFAQQAEIPFLDVTTVFAEVDGNSISASQFCQCGRPDWIGFESAPCLSDGGNMIDVDAQFGHILLLVSAPKVNSG